MKAKERKDASIKFRLTQEDKEAYLRFCEQRGLKVSEELRNFIRRELGKKI